MPLLHQGAARRGLHASRENPGGVRVRVLCETLARLCEREVGLPSGTKRLWARWDSIPHRRVGVRSRGPWGVLPGELLHNRREGRGRCVRGTALSGKLNPVSYFSGVEKGTCPIVADDARLVTSSRDMTSRARQLCRATASLAAARGGARRALGASRARRRSSTRANGEARHRRHLATGRRRRATRITAATRPPPRSQPSAAIRATGPIPPSNPPRPRRGRHRGYARPPVGPKVAQVDPFRRQPPVDSPRALTSRTPARFPSDAPGRAQRAVRGGAGVLDGPAEFSQRRRARPCPGRSSDGARSRAPARSPRRVEKELGMRAAFRVEIENNLPLSGSIEWDDW